MPQWAWILLGAVALIGIVMYFMNTGTANKLPSGNTTTKPATVNDSGTTYGNLT